MSANDKIYLRATALQVAGCTGEAFKAWRNRLGLFPETQKADGWNRYSFTDIVTLALVNELTRRGIVAQVAVATGMVVRPVLTELFEVKLTKEVAGQTDALASAVLKRMEKLDAFELQLFLPYDYAGPDCKYADQPTCKLMPALSPVQFSDQGSGLKTVVVIDLFQTVFFLFGLMHIMGTETELSDGTRRIEPGIGKAVLAQRVAIPKKAPALRKPAASSKRVKR